MPQMLLKELNISLFSYIFIVFLLHFSPLIQILPEALISFAHMRCLCTVTSTEHKRGRTGDEKSEAIRRLKDSVFYNLFEGFCRYLYRRVQRADRKQCGRDRESWRHTNSGLMKVCLLNMLKNILRFRNIINYVVF